MNNHQLQQLLKDIVSADLKRIDAAASAESHLNRAIYNLYVTSGMPKDASTEFSQRVIDAAEEMSYYPNTAEYPRGTESPPKEMYNFFRRLLDPNDLGYAVSGEVRDYARMFLGIEPCESYLRKNIIHQPFPRL